MIGSRAAPKVDVFLFLSVWVKNGYQYLICWCAFIAHVAPFADENVVLVTWGLAELGLF
jgi:hypothetical protein